jgi:hypothetical protein
LLAGKERVKRRLGPSVVAILHGPPGASKLALACGANLTFRKPGQYRQADSAAGVDVMITIICDFCQFSAKKWRFFKKTML